MTFKLSTIFLVVFTALNFCVNTVSAKDYSVSKSGMEFIKTKETLKLTSYWDSNGYTIGYGHHTKDVKKNQTISNAQANALFSDDIAKTNNSINRLLSPFLDKHNFSQKFVDGLGDLIFNCGESGVRNSEFYRRLLACRYDKKTKSFNKKDLEYTLVAVKTLRVKCNGHKTRRNEVYNIMRNGEI